MPPNLNFQGLHHIKLPAHNLQTTKSFYTTHLPFTHLPSLDHIDPTTYSLYAIILAHPSSNIRLEIRHAPDQAEKQRGWDPITWAVPSRNDLEAWRAYFEKEGVKCSRVLKGAKGWVLVAEDPDGRRVRLYTLEEHEMTEDTDHDAFWLGN